MTGIRAKVGDSRQTGDKHFGRAPNNEVDRLRCTRSHSPGRCLPEDSCNAEGRHAGPATQAGCSISSDTGSFAPDCGPHLDRSDADNYGVANISYIFVTTDIGSLRINLVLRKDRDGELFRRMANALAGVPDRDRAEVVRREIAIWLALQPSRTLPTPTPASSETTPASSSAAIGRSADYPGIPGSPAVPAPEGKLDMSQLNGVEMEFEFFNSK